METFTAVLVLLGLIGISKIVNRFIPFVPVPLIQIGFGVIVAALPWGIHLTLEPELFFVLFIAPLLFNDGRRTPRAELWNLRAPILLLALGLVFATVLVAGYAIHWMIPSIPVAAAFALAAILSPTDAVAVSALAGRVHLPKNIHRVLEGESLMNDASGLVAFKFAVAAAVTGVFSLSQAIGSFIFIAAGGLLAGAALSFLLIRLSVFIRRMGMEDVTVHVLLQVLTPFLIYLVSEELGLSGILAVVAGGIVQAIEKDRTDSPQYKLQLVSASIWSVLLFILNGMVFLILGVSIPDVVSVIYRDTAVDNLTVVLYVLAITALLIVLRFVWVYLICMRSARFKNGGKPSMKSRVITSISGVRGAVTLAGAFSIPLVLDDGSPFPERDLIIFLAAGVILTSLLIASILLPLIARKEEDSREESEQAAKSQIMKTCMAILRSGAAEDNRADAVPAAPRLPDTLPALPEIQQTRRINNPEEEYGKRCALKARLTGLQAERRELSGLIADGSISSEAGQAIMELLDHKEALLTRGLDSQLRLSLDKLGRLFSGIFSKLPKGADGSVALPVGSIREARIGMCRAAMDAIQEETNDDNRDGYGSVAARYGMMVDRLQQSETGSAAELQEGRQLEWKLEAIQEQRDAVQRMFEDGTLGRKATAQLRWFVDELEMSIWED
ncbi:Na+/H+ antiporter [Paenibacillus sp. URB8-2]|uniref:Na+/H+ antiporter n=1 Tax=Paenibacillus sp. URB8-2 TaxID=2741301 RepID=UPI0015C0C913|nr:Na+/H+ antiporter [Paenibacillus sp. URB8-2]BCG58886.1 sodium, potassium, lithium and rubidium/H(+) antiporter [Paenibacillus sp. URB8-2]